jgi:integrase/recombinase XerD
MSQILVDTQPDNLMGQFIGGFLLERESRGLAPGTLRTYADELRRFSMWAGPAGIADVEDITPDLLRRFLLHLAETRNAGGVHITFRVVRSFLIWYVNEFEPDGWKNPISKVKPPKPNNQPLPGVDQEAFGKLIAACDGPMKQRDKTALLFLLDTGVRAAEFCALNIGDLDVMSGAVTILHGKGNKRRIVYVGQTVLKELRRCLKPRKLSPEAPLFILDDGQRINFGALRDLVKRLSKRAAIESPGLHDFRRAFAVNMLRNGCDVITLARLMGHNNMSITERYLFLVEEDLRNGHSKGSPVDNMATKNN